MSGESTDLGTRIAQSGLDTPDDMRRAILEAAERLSQAVERLRVWLAAREKVGSS